MGVAETERVQRAERLTSGDTEVDIVIDGENDTLADAVGDNVT